MEITPGILKSIDSGIEVETRGIRVGEKSIFILKYMGNLTVLSDNLHYDSENKAKSAVENFGT